MERILGYQVQHSVNNARNNRIGSDLALVLISGRFLVIVSLSKLNLSLHERNGSSLFSGLSFSLSLISLSLSPSLISRLYIVLQVVD